MSLSRISLVLVGLIAVSAPAAAQEKKPLVTRDRVQLNLAGAETVLEGAKKKAAALGLTDDFVVAPADGSQTGDDYEDLAGSVPAARLHQFRARGRLPRRGQLSRAERPRPNQVARRGDFEAHIGS